MPKIIRHIPKVHRESSYDRDNLRLTLTCQSGLESLVRRECEKIGLKEITGQDRLISGTGTLTQMYELLVKSRFSNRVYIEVLPPFEGGVEGGSTREGSRKSSVANATAPRLPTGRLSERSSLNITDFDTLHDTLADISWSDYVTGKELIVIEAASTRSVLSHTPTIQAVAQKAIFSTLHTPNNANAIEVHILILIIDDIAHVMLDVTGDPLHKRGYRQEAGEAPIKENLAAALVAFASWKYREPLLDPFCGSGTIAIEAAMLARNIAPGVKRHFRIESLPFHDREELTSVRNIARMKAYPSGEYTIHASDIDPAMVKIAKRNAERAGVEKDIIFSVSDFLEPTIQLSDYPTILITNPPYGKRLESEDLDAIYTKLIHEVSEHGGGFITDYGVDVRFGLANRKLLNGSEECRFWYKKL